MKSKKSWYTKLFFILCLLCNLVIFRNILLVDDIEIITIEETDKIINTDWNLSNTDVSTNGNLEFAVKTMREEIDTSQYRDNYVDGTKLHNAPWDYYGTPIVIAGNIERIAIYLEDSEVSRLYFNEKLCFGINVTTKDGTQILVYVEGELGDLTFGDYIEVMGYTAGQLYGTNEHREEIHFTAMVGYKVFK